MSMMRREFQGLPVHNLAGRNDAIPAAASLVSRIAQICPNASVASTPVALQ